MEAKSYSLILIALIAGVLGGYIVGSMAFQNQFLSLQLQVENLQVTITEKNAKIADLQSTIADLQQTIALFTGIDPYTRYEELKIKSTYINTATDTCTIEIRNTGTANATISDVLVNGRLPSNGGWSSDAPDDILLTGDEATITVSASEYLIGSFSHGVIYDFQIHTSGGGSYPASARAP